MGNDASSLWTLLRLMYPPDMQNGIHISKHIVHQRKKKADPM